MRILKTYTYYFTHQASNLKQFICKTCSNLRKTAHSQVRKDSVHELSGPSSRSIYVNSLGKKRLRVLLLPPTWDATSSKLLPHAFHQAA